MLERTNIAEIALHFDLKRKSSHPTVLVLGSRAGGLFRSQELAGAVQRFFGHNQPVSSQEDPFEVAYHFFEQARSGKSWLPHLLKRFLQDVRVAEADLSLAELIKQRLFRVVISTNIDGLLEEALDRAGLRRIFEFEVLVPKQGADFDPDPPEHQVRCQLIKAFGDLSDLSSHEIIKDKSYLDNHPSWKAWLEKTLKGDVLAVGLDVNWDQEIIRAFSSSKNALWFVHEKDLQDHQVVKRAFHERQVKYIAGEEGVCGTFFQELRQRLAPSLPPISPRETLINRSAELQEIDKAFASLVDQDMFQKTPVLTFYGIGGIGKTALVQYVARRCQYEKMPFIRVDAQDIAGLARSIQEQVSRYSQIDTLLTNYDNWLDRSVIVTSQLLRQGPAVILVDALSTSEQMIWLGNLLKDVHVVNRIFVILTSNKRKLTFEVPDRQFSRRLRILPLVLKALDRESCYEYLSQPDLQLEADVRDIVYEWTHGYPLALLVMKDAIASGLDPRKDEDRLSILAQLVERVITQKILARVESERVARFQRILGLLSFPRRSSLDTIGKLIERFAPDLRRESRSAYLTIPKEIDEVTEVFSWDALRAGYAVDSSVRNLFLLEYRVRQPEQYRAIHHFLVQLNEEQIGITTGIDRVRCLREYLYHLVCLGEDAPLVRQLELALWPFIQQTPEELPQFYDEVIQDEELQEACGQHREVIFSCIHKALAIVNQQFASETSGAARIHFLHVFLSHLMQIQEVQTLPFALTARLSDLVQQPASEQVVGLYQDLLAQSSFAALLQFTVQRSAEPSAQQSAPGQELAPEQEEFAGPAISPDPSNLEEQGNSS